MPFLMRITIHGFKDRAITLKMQEAMSGNFPPRRIAFKLPVNKHKIIKFHSAFTSFHNGKINLGGKHGCHFPYTCMVGVF
jgi:hypothetical protein